jgi:hypothetical protein
MEERFVIFVATDLFMRSFSSEDLCKSIFEGGFKFMVTVLCNPSFPAGETIFMGLSTEQQSIVKMSEKRKHTYILEDHIMILQ